MISNDINLFTDFIQALMQTMTRAKFIFTSKACVQFQAFQSQEASFQNENSESKALKKSDSSYVMNFGCKRYTLKHLKQNDVLKLLEMKSPDSVDVMNQIKELMRLYPCSSKKQISTSTDHDLFRMLGGHPPSVISLAYLLGESTLVEIYEQLKKIKESQKVKVMKKSMLITALMVESLLKFLDKQNSEAKSILYFI